MNPTILGLLIVIAVLFFVAWLVSRAQVKQTREYYAKHVNTLNAANAEEIKALNAAHEQAIKDLKAKSTQKRDDAGHFTFDGNDCPKCAAKKAVKVS